jgi:hypothetical protein
MTPAFLLLAVMPVVAWTPVPPADATKLAAADFADDELDLPYYLAHFHRLANSVVEHGPDRGFIDIRVWRNPQDNRPYNARVMENILSLAFFYSTRRPWNPYYASPAVRARLEAALEFWCAMQEPEGRFSEYGVAKWNLPATAFATKFMGETLRLLEDGPPVDRALLERVVVADRKAIRVVLTDEDFRQHGRDFSNQYTNVWAGGLAFLRIHPDAALEALLARRMKEDAPAFQSPAGYFYERRGPDWGYNLGTHHSNLWMTWHYTQGTELGRLVVESERRFVEWLAYNAVPEPDESGFVLNRAIETRQQRGFLDRLAWRRGQEGQGQRLIASEVELARAFLPTREEVVRERAQRRAERDWATLRDYSPYAFLHRAQGSWYPSESERQAARLRLPCLQQPFVQQRMDSREPVVFTYVRQPAYYAAFNSGRQLAPQQRYGIGLVWTPEVGAVVQSQTGTTQAAWGTGAGDEAVYEAGTLEAEFRSNGSVVAPRAGIHDLASGVLEVRYPLGGRGEKTVRFEEKSIRVGVDHEGAFREQIPLLLREGESVALQPAGATLSRGGNSVAVHYDQGTRAEVVETGIAVGPRRVVTLVLRARDRLRYGLVFQPKR